MNVSSKWGMYERKYENAPDVKTPTTCNPFDSADYDPATGTVLREHAAEKSVILSLPGEYSILQHLSVYSVADCLFVRNRDNAEERNTTGFQFTFDVGWTI